jgi:hypothetical protein
MECYIGAGTIYVKDLSVADQPYLSLGNVQASLAIEEEVQELPDYESVAGGNKCEVRDISSVALNITSYDFDKKNLALAVFGSSEVDAGASIVNEAVQLFLEGGAPLEHIPTNTGTLTVGVTTYTYETDYTIDGAVIKVVAGSALATAIAAELTDPPFLDAEFDYTHADEDLVKALVTSGKTFAAFIVTKNKADGAKVSTFRMHKLQFGPVANLPLISREFGEYELLAAVLADDTQGVGESRFFKIVQTQ